MNKIAFLLITLFITISFQSCKKDSGPSQPQQKTYLLKSIIMGGSATEKFEYDDRSRMKTWTLFDGDQYRFAYDTQDRLAEVQIYEEHRDLVIYVLTYTYEANNVHMTKKYDYQNTHTVLKQTYELSNDRVVKISFDDDGRYYTKLGYDGAGNVISVIDVNEKDHTTSESKFEYDNKKGAFSMLRKGNIYYFLDSFSPRAGFTNNIVKSIVPDQSVYFSITYQYNEDGFPISGVTKYRDYNDENFTYEYIVK